MSSAEPEWLIAECDDQLAESLAQDCGIPRAAARVLCLRDIKSADEAKRFLNPSLDHLHDPSLLPDLDVGANRIVSALRSGEPICVHGDYDVDGITSTALLVRTLRALKGNVTFRVPHRRRDGYDIKPTFIDEAARDGVQVILTCDCGVTAFETADRAESAGIDLIVTDHHEPEDRIPRALAVVNPKRHDADYPFPELAGVGVAFKFAQGVVRAMGLDEETFLTRFLDLAALGTVGDVVPLLDENRAIVKHGIPAIESSRKTGLRTLLEATRLRDRPLTAHALGFVLGPRINAVGRLQDASTALRLLLTTDEAEAREIASELERCNTQRRAEQERILKEALAQIDGQNKQSAQVLVLSSKDWNPGIVGIVAQKICEMFSRPTVLISRDEASGVGGGSARSTPEFNLIEALRGCADLLDRFGGHASAAGLTINLENIPRFEERLSEIFESSAGVAVPEIYLEADAELAPQEITRELADLVSAMEPFGTGNPEPLFISRNLVVDRRERVGDGSHLKMRVSGRGCGPLECIAFGMGGLASELTLGGRVDLCYNIRLNTFNGSQVVQLVCREIRHS